MDAQKLLVHDGSQRKSAERLHTRLVDSFGVLVLALELEGEVVCQMSALVIATQQPECIWVPDLESPKVENALRKSASAGQIP